MPATIPNNYRDLIVAFPDLHEMFFDAGGKLNPFGELAAQNLVMREMLRAGTFVFYTKDEVLTFLLDRSIPVSAEATETQLQNIASECLTAMGITDKKPTIKII